MKGDENQDLVENGEHLFSGMQLFNNKRKFLIQQRYGHATEYKRKRHFTQNEVDGKCHVLIPRALARKEAVICWLRSRIR